MGELVVSQGVGVVGLIVLLDEITGKVAEEYKTQALDCLKLRVRKVVQDVCYYTSSPVLNEDLETADKFMPCRDVNPMLHHPRIETLLIVLTVVKDSTLDTP